MNIEIIEHEKEVPDTLRVTIHCRHTDEEVLRLRNYISLFEKKLHAKKDDEYYFIQSADVLYFEAVDNRTFLYTSDCVLEVTQRLYELEYLLSDRDFVRISKSLIININKVHSLKPELNRTILATMCNGEQLSISRRYAQNIKKLLSI